MKVPFWFQRDGADRPGTSERLCRLTPHVDLGLYSAGREFCLLGSFEVVCHDYLTGAEESVVKEH